MTTVLTAILGALFTYRELIGFSNVAVVFQYAITCAAVPVLRRRNPESGQNRQGFRVPFGPVIPVFGALGSIGLLYGSDLQEFALAGGGIALGFVVRFVTVRLFDRS